MDVPYSYFWTSSILTLTQLKFTMPSTVTGAYAIF
jgi:hypothetical protein